MTSFANDGVAGLLVSLLFCSEIVPFFAMQMSWTWAIRERLISAVSWRVHPPNKLSLAISDVTFSPQKQKGSRNMMAFRKKKWWDFFIVLA